MPVRIQGIEELRRELRASGVNADKALKKVYRRVARMEQTHARRNAVAVGGVYAKARTAIRGDQTARSASVGVSNSGRIPFAQAAYWGTKKRTGWYAGGQYHDHPRQHPEWVGNTWDVGRFDQGPYVINFTIAEDMPEIIDKFWSGIDETFADAFDD